MTCATTSGPGKAYPSRQLHILRTGGAKFAPLTPHSKTGEFAWRDGGPKLKTRTTLLANLRVMVRLPVGQPIGYQRDQPDSAWLAVPRGGAPILGLSREDVTLGKFTGTSVYEEPPMLACCT